MVHNESLELSLDGYGGYLGRGEGCFEVRDKQGNIERYLHFEKEIGEYVLKSGNYISVDALIDLALWNIDTYVMTQKNRVVAVLKKTLMNEECLLFAKYLRNERETWIPRTCSF